MIQSLKCTVIIAPDREREVIVYAKEYDRTVEKIKNAAECEDGTVIYGYTGNDILPLNPDEVSAFITESGRQYALFGKEKLRVKERIGRLEELLPDSFIKINQSCIANTKMIERFKVSVGASLSVVFKNGYTDYVSRRCLGAVKKKLGL